MLNFSNAKKTVTAMTAGILSTLMIATPVLAEVKVVFDEFVRDCTIYYSGLADPIECRRYVVTYDPQSNTYAHHFIVDSSGRKTIMLFSPEFSLPQRREAIFKITSVTINNDGQKVRSRGNGRCKLNVELLSCSFFHFESEEILNVNVKL